MVTLIAIASFVLVLVVILATAYLLMQRTAGSRLLKQRLQSVDAAAARRPSPELDLLRSELLSEIPVLNRFLLSSGRGERLQRALDQARVSIRPGAFILLTFAGASVGLLLGNMFTHHLLLALIAAVFGGAIPFVYVSFLRRRRLKKFEEKFPEAIDFLGRSIRAGHAFSTALELIADETEEPIAGEFRKLFEEQKFGLPLRDAMQNLSERVPLIDVKFFGTAVLLQKETGGNLAELLDKLSYVIRERFKILRQLRVYTAQGRLTMMILMAMPPILLVILSLFNPEFIRPLYADPMGHTLLAIGIVLQAAGFFLIRRIIDIKV